MKMPIAEQSGIRLGLEEGNKVESLIRLDGKK
jgi:hypothetical protein